MLEAHFHNRRADETLRFYCLTRSLLARAVAVSTGSISPNGYYAWRKRVLTTPAAALVLPAWQVAAQRVFTTHAGRYGQRRLRAQLRHEGHAVGRQRLRGWLSARGLHALCTRASTRPPRTPRPTRRR